MMTLEEYAQLYIARGWKIVPLAPKEKACHFDKWREMEFEPHHLAGDSNIGLKHTKVEGKGILTITDADSAEAVFVSDAFLPPTGAIYGRPTKPRAKRLFYTQTSQRIVYKDFGSKGDATLIEIRSNHQDMAPPSTHPSGELLAWDGVIGEPAIIADKDLQRAVKLVATTSLIARYYNPSGNRHDWALAVSGCLRGLDVSYDEAKMIFVMAGKWVHEPDLKDRINAVTSTYDKGDEENIKSSGALKGLMNDSAVFLKSLYTIWGAYHSGFSIDSKERIIANDQTNVKLAFKKLEINLVFDSFERKPKIIYNGYKGILDNYVRNKIWLEIDSKFHFRPSGEFFDIVLDVISRENAYHPVVQYLDNLKWDKTPRLENWIIKSAKAANTPYVKAISSIVLIAAVRRVKHPGCKFDELLVLESKQGYNKSSMLRALCPNEDWFSDDLPLNVDSRQIIERTSGKWIIEAAELAGMRGQQFEHLKSMLSRQVDGPVRLAYDRVASEQPRQFIIIGTTNSHIYLGDQTGNRRFWPIRVDAFDLDYIADNRDQLWAEAVYQEKAGVPIRLEQNLWDHANIQQERRTVEDPWEQTIISAFPYESHRLAPNEIWDALGVPIAQRNMLGMTRISIIMQKLGFIQKTVVDKGGRRVRGWAKGPWKRGMKEIEDKDTYEAAIQYLKYGPDKQTEH
jgi:Virulence-associated protein E/Bifunctional DNA primase/polymerase, N-terminal